MNLEPRNTVKVSAAPRPPHVDRALPSGAAPVAPASLGERVAHRLAQARYALPLVGLSLLAIGWSLLFRLPHASKAVEARTTDRGGRSEFVTNAVIVRELEDQAQMASQQLIHDQAEFPRLVSRLEESARSLGFQAQTTIKPAITNAFGFKELSVHPVLFRLDTKERREQPAFARVLDWLRYVSSLGRKVESQSVSLASQADGLASAQVELQFWSINKHDQPAKK